MLIAKKKQKTVVSFLSFNINMKSNEKLLIGKSEYKFHN